MRELYDLDFDALKENIKKFMSTLDDFKDYNFEGSASSQIIDVLAYITQVPAFYLNQALNEFFMKTVQLKDNTYKLAHQLNYLPGRKSSPYIDVEFVRTDTYTILIPKFTKFLMGEKYLTNIDDVIISDDDTHIVRLYLGEVVEETFSSDGKKNQIYDLENRETIDNDYFYVYVDTSDGSGGYVVNNTPWINVNEESFDTLTNGFFIRYFDIFQIAFDSGTLFNIPVSGDRIRVIYINTDGTTNNGLTGSVELETPGDISNVDYLTITNTDTSHNGTYEESETDIKARSPLFYTTQNRGITEKDYNIIIKRYSQYDNFYGANIWGGEKEYLDGDQEFVESSPIRDLGHVLISTINTDLTHLDFTEIDDIFTFLTKYKIISIFYKFIYPNIIQIEPTININYDAVLDFSLNDIEDNVNDFLELNNGFEKSFYLSDLIRYVDNLDNIKYVTISYDSTIKVKDELIKIIRFGGEISPNSILGEIDGFNLTDDGSGNIIYRSVIIGSINYTTGFCRIDYNFGSSVDDYTLNFEYTDIQKIILEKEQFLFHKPIILNTI